MRLTDFTVLTFDCHATLIDLESGIVAAPQPPAAAPMCANPDGDSLILICLNAESVRPG